MKTLADIGKRLSKLAIDNSPAILTGIGVAGTVATAVLTGKAAFKAAEILNHEAYLNAAPGVRIRKVYDTKAKFLLTWKLYIPPAATAALTVTAIIFANRIGTRRAAAIAAAYSLSEKAFAEYREKIVEKLGETKEKKVRDEIAQDRVTRNPPSSEVLVLGDGNVLCLDTYTGRYFRTTAEQIRKAENLINYQILHYNYATLTDFFQHIGLEPTIHSDEVGWTTDHQLDIYISTAKTPDDKPCLTIQFNVAPVRDYDKLI